MKKCFKASIASGLITALLLIIPSAFADPVVNQVSGISGYVDKGLRNPVLTVSHEIKADGVQILADAKIDNKEFEEFPVQFSFFVNRQLYKTQIRSVAQGNEVGIFVPSTELPAPFNYSVLATVIHPNRQYASYFEGITFDSQLTTKLNCTAGTTINSYLAEDISASQSSNSKTELSFLAESESDNTQTSQVAASLSIIDGSKASGTLTITPSSGGAVTSEVTGTVTFSGGKLSNISVSSADGKASLTCTEVSVKTEAVTTSDTSGDSSTEFTLADESNSADISTDDDLVPEALGLPGSRVE